MSKTTKTSGKPQVVFFGSGPVSAKSLELLCNEFEIEAIITKPTTLHEMKTVAGDSPIHTVVNKQELDKLIETATFQSRVAILIDFGIIVSRKVINYFPYGIVNSHFSLLPELRGADPISFAILSGQKQTGVSLMLLVEAMDEGPLLAQTPYEISPNETTPSLTEALIELSAESLKEIVPLWLNDSIQPARQEDVTMASRMDPSYSRKLTKDDGVMDFTKPAEQLEREIRAFIDWPKSRTTIAGKDVIITKAYTTPVNYPDEKPGHVGVVPEAKALYITTVNGTLWIEQLKPAGKKEMTTEAFLAGHKLSL